MLSNCHADKLNTHNILASKLATKLIPDLREMAADEIHKGPKIAGPPLGVPANSGRGEKQAGPTASLHPFCIPTA